MRGIPVPLSLPIFFHIEAGTGFVHAGQFAVAHNAGVRIVGAQAVEQGTEGGALRPGACVGRMAVGGEAALVADADAVLVDPLGMCTFLMVTLPSAIVVYCTCNSFF